MSLVADDGRRRRDPRQQRGQRRRGRGRAPHVGQRRGRGRGRGRGRAALAAQHGHVAPAARARQAVPLPPAAHHQLPPAARRGPPQPGGACGPLRVRLCEAECNAACVVAATPVGRGVRGHPADRAAGLLPPAAVAPQRAQAPREALLEHLVVIILTIFLLDDLPAITTFYFVYSDDIITFHIIIIYLISIMCRARTAAAAPRSLMPCL